MKIATLNIDWAKKAKNQKQKITKALHQNDFDFLILTEAITLELQNYKFHYSSEQLPLNVVYEGVQYGEYLDNQKAYRTIIYSKIKAINSFNLIDNKTSCAAEFQTQFGNIIIYGTIIGTQFRKRPFAEKELENCIKDCHNLFIQNPNLVIVGDLNTSFQTSEIQYQINKKTTQSIEKLVKDLKLYIATKEIERNIDHIIIPQKIQKEIISSTEFIGKNILSDHKGVKIELNKI